MPKHQSTRHGQAPGLGPQNGEIQRGTAQRETNNRRPKEGKHKGEIKKCCFYKFLKKERCENERCHFHIKKKKQLL